jgi:hypothetical protein
MLSSWRMYEMHPALSFKTGCYSISGPAFSGFLDGNVKTYIEEFLTTFSGFYQMVFSFLTAYRLQQLFP